MARIGLLAGEGKLPAIFSKIAKSRGDTVIAFALKGVASDELGRHVDKVHWLEWGSLKKAMLLLATERINSVIMLGKLKKEEFFKKEAGLDAEAKKVLDKIKDKKDYAILNEINNVFSKVGIKILNITDYLKDFIPAKGVLTRRAPTAGEDLDIKYGADVAKKLSGFDIGQTITVKDNTVIAVEAMEGTDETILRSGILSGGGFVVVKMARPDQDMRFDVPLVGLETIKAMIKSGAKALALESGKTILIDREDAVRLADDSGISLVII